MFHRKYWLLWLADTNVSTC